jgi:hypothetical protein
MVGPSPVLAIANAPLAPLVVPPLAQPPSELAAASISAAKAARLALNKVIDASLIVLRAIALKSINV